jgi:CRISPR system Cascade subunit CasE
VNGKVEGRKAGSLITVASVLFDGILEVVDTALLREALQTGIGRAKSYGQGLLSLAPARELDVPQ